MSPYNDDLTLQQATDYLRQIHEIFPFADWYDFERGDDEWFEGGKVRQSRSMAVHIGAMLSQFAIGILPRGANRMGFIYNANSQRSGKTLLCKMAVMPLYRVFKAQSWKVEEAELSKVIDAEVMAGSTYICFDNVRGHVGNQALEGLMTSPDWTGRILGRTEMFTAPNRLTLFITGNDILVSPDMAHRCLTCDLFVSEGDVQEREIPVERVIDEPWLKDKSNRHMILSSLWAIVRNWHAAGMPKASHYGCKPRLGFERWGELIGGMVAFAGFGNCLEKPVLENAGDSQDRNIRRLLAAMNQERMKPALDEMAIAEAERREFTFQNLVDMCDQDSIFDWMLEGRKEYGNFKLNPRACSKLGTLFSRYAPSADSREKSRTYRIPTSNKNDHGEPETIVVKLFSKGEGRHKRYVFEVLDTK
jgi:hypothetical protein